MIKLAEHLSPVGLIDALQDKMVKKALCFFFLSKMAISNFQTRNKTTTAAPQNLQLPLAIKVFSNSPEDEFFLPLPINPNMHATHTCSCGQSCVTRTPPDTHLLHGADVAGLRELDGLKAELRLHAADPLGSLALGVDHQRPAPGLGGGGHRHHYRVLQRRVVCAGDIGEPGEAVEAWAAEKNTSSHRTGG